MGNYPNMSYCMNGNTLLALRQVVEAMNEEGPAFLKEMSREELQEEYEREQRDGQPSEQ